MLILVICKKSNFFQYFNLFIKGINEKVKTSNRYNFYLY